MKYDFSLSACYESVVWEVEFLHADPVRELGRAIIRADQDIFFNKTMIDAWRKYIEDHNIRWDD